MTRIFIAAIALAALLALTGADRPKEGRIKVTVSLDSMKAGEVMYLMINRERKERIAGAYPQNGQYSFSVKTETPALFHLELSNGAVPARFFAADGDELRITGNRRNLFTVAVAGSALNDQYRQYEARVKKEHDALAANNPNNLAYDPTPAALDFIKQHPGSPVAAYLLFRGIPPARISGSELQQLWNGLRPEVREGLYGRIVAGRIAIAKSTDIGRPFIEVALPDTSGRNTRLSDYVKQGYVLVDFWASWCIPCRGENRYMKAACEKYRNRGFSVFSISLDNKKEPWTAAIRRDTLAWVHVSDLKYWDCAPAKSYGVIAVPANVLVAPNGDIVARNLRGQALLDTLAHIYGAAAH